jgi:hypothetical protein
MGGGEGRCPVACLTGVSGSNGSLATSFSPDTWAPVLPSFPQLTISLQSLAPSLSSFQMWQHLAKAEAKLHSPDSRGRQELSESVYTDVLDRSCSQSWQE